MNCEIKGVFNTKSGNDEIALQVRVIFGGVGKC